MKTVDYSRENRLLIFVCSVGYHGSSFWLNQSPHVSSSIAQSHFVTLCLLWWATLNILECSKIETLGWSLGWSIAFMLLSCSLFFFFSILITYLFRVVSSGPAAFYSFYSFFFLSLSSFCLFVVMLLYALCFMCRMLLSFQVSFCNEHFLPACCSEELLQEPYTDC